MTWRMIRTTLALVVLILSLAPGLEAEAFLQPAMGVPTGVGENPSERVPAPILLYHHVRPGDSDSRYVVTPGMFAAQMRSLRAWGYNPVPISRVLDALLNEARLPPRPVVITFDDGYEDVYEYAFPILSRYGFSGVVYLVGDKLDAPGFLSRLQIAELVAAGWEVGSHTQNHADLTRVQVDLVEEIEDSKRFLESALSIPMETFAYPYGMATPRIRGLVEESGYRGAVGVGPLWKHSSGSRFFLSRIEIHGQDDLIEFASRLPWYDFYALRGWMRLSLKNYAFY
jgi:peptidoglycan/xylan/chitin deacetylase (PgdA/CDA1 family)